MDVTLAPSPGSFAKSFKENPAAREDARSGRFAPMFRSSKPSVVLDDVVVYEESESDSEPESVSESGGWYGVYLEGFIPTFYE